MSDDLPALVQDSLHQIDTDALNAPNGPTHKPRILLLYGSLRDQSVGWIWFWSMRGLPPFGSPVATIKTSAPAKVNLTLHVTGRRDDGYHENPD